MNNQEIIEAATEYIALNKTSANKLAKKAGISPAYLSAMLNGSETFQNTKISDSHYFKLADAIGFERTENLHWDTDTFVRITQKCMKCQLLAKRAIIEGISGSGKTYALETYAAKNDKVIYVKSTSSMTAKDLLSEILEKLYQKNTPKSPRKMLQEIKRLTTDGGWLIIIDELEDVKIAVYKTVKEIADFCEKKAGFIVCGVGLNEFFLKKADKSRTPFMQLHRRFRGNILRVSGLSYEETINIVGRMGFAKRDVVAFFQRNCEDYDMLKEYLTDLANLQKKQEISSNEVDVELLKSFFQ